MVKTFIGLKFCLYSKKDETYLKTTKQKNETCVMLSACLMLTLIELLMIYSSHPGKTKLFQNKTSKTENHRSVTRLCYYFIMLYILILVAFFGRHHWFFTNFSYPTCPSSVNTSTLIWLCWQITARASWKSFFFFFGRWRCFSAGQLGLSHHTDVEMSEQPGYAVACEMFVKRLISCWVIDRYYVSIKLLML